MRMSLIGLSVVLAIAIAVVGSAGPTFAQYGSPASAVKVVLTAEDAWEKGMGGLGVQKALKGGGVTLYDATLIEDDGPGSGENSQYQIDEDRSLRILLDAGNIAKKVLVVDRPEALAAHMYVRGPILVEVNGKAIGAAGSAVRIPPELIKKGENVVILRARPDANAIIKGSARTHILANNPELKDRPPRSFTSRDGGKTWTAIDGEIVCRLTLTQYPAEGSLISPVIDLGQAEGNAVAFTKAAFRSVAMTAEADTPAGTGVEFLIRTGPGPVYEAANWTDWQPAKTAAPKDHRFLQWKAVLRTLDPKVTPTLRSVTCAASAAAEPAPAWAAKLAVTGAHNEEIRYTNMPFEYEDPRNPRVIALREKYKLDAVVKDGNTELEKLILLRNWVNAQWRYKPPIETKYPAWDADEIMSRKVGFCVQFAITYVQCCTALGYQARFVFGDPPSGTHVSGHEVTEVWSNQFGKWIFMDPEGNRYYIDPNTKEPLGMLEAHDRMIRAFFGAKPPYSKTPQCRYSDEIMSVNGKTIIPDKMLTSADPPPKSWPAWVKWYHIQYVPRNNFYSKPAPLPRIEGWGNWEWPGFWSWYDDRVSRETYYRNFTNRHSDLEWTINQVRFAASWGAKEGTLAVQMGTVTPNFETFLVRTAGGAWKPSGGEFTWDLSPGKNRLEMRVRNVSGVEGPVSWLEVEKK